ncbi:MAG TPA: FAD:protein FMN transferase, partial [Kofleriaceae bacterium]|nr:FAD:protein FMN transferase [Kofleriaceae bacterium]
MIDAGGDMVLSGAGPDGDGWLVDIEDPDDPRSVLATLCVRDRAVATSAPNRRRWRRGPGDAHHLIDPRTGLPSRSDLAQVTMLAPTAEQADVLAKTAFLLGAREARRFVGARSELAAVLVHRDGTLEIAGDVELVDERPEVCHG